MTYIANGVSKAIMMLRVSSLIDLGFSPQRARDLADEMSGKLRGDIGREARALAEKAGLVEAAPEEVDDIIEAVREGSELPDDPAELRRLQRAGQLGERARQAAKDVEESRARGALDDEVRSAIRNR